MDRRAEPGQAGALAPVVGTGLATKVIKTGMLIRVDGSTGAVSITR